MPSTFDSMSWVANPLPENSTWIQPPRTSRATSGPPPVWITAGPHTASTDAPAARAPRMRSATCLTRRPFGFSDDTSESMNSKADRPRDGSGACTRTPWLPTTTRSPTRTRCMGTVRTVPSAATTRPQSISGFATGTQCPSRRTSEGRLVVE